MQTLRCTLRPGQQVVAGNVSVKVSEGGCAIVGVGRDLAFVLRRNLGGTAHNLQVFNAGKRIVQKIPAEPQLAIGNRKSAIEPPLCLFGPGGDYVRDLTVEQMSNASRRAGSQTPIENRKLAIGDRDAAGSA